MTRMPERRAAQLAVAMDRPVTGTLYLRPNDDHWLSVQVGAASFLLHRGQLERVEKLFAAARVEMEADGYRTNDRLYAHSIRLGRF